MCYWKQWGTTRKRVGELMKRGVSEKHAVSVGMSRKGYWHLAKNEAMNVGLSNAYLKREGLTSIRTLWIKIYYPATAR
jgi:RNA-directed DNA polymerase